MDQSGCLDCGNPSRGPATTSDPSGVDRFGFDPSGTGHVGTTLSGGGASPVEIGAGLLILFGSIFGLGGGGKGDSGGGSPGESPFPEPNSGPSRYPMLQTWEVAPGFWPFLGPVDTMSNMLGQHQTEHSTDPELAGGPPRQDLGEGSGAAHGVDALGSFLPHIAVTDPDVASGPFIFLSFETNLFTLVKDLGALVGFQSWSPGWVPSNEVTFFAGSNVKEGEYVSAVVSQSILTGIPEFGYSEGHGDEYTLTSPGERPTTFDQNQLFFGAGGFGRYETGEGDVGSYAYVGIEAGFLNIAGGVGLSDPGLNVLIRPLAPIGAFRNPEFGYRSFEIPGLRE
jgi:hypothetical protein